MALDHLSGAGSSAPGLRRSLLWQYRAMAFVTATLLIVLVFVGVPLQVAAGRPGVVNVVGTMHGFLYIVYLVTAFRLTRRLSVPKWQMFLVLLAGTVPFCAFVAERKMSRRFALATPGSVPSAPQRRSGQAFRRRWLSGRSLLLHLEVLIVAPGCAVAGWWQATRALAGNDLSWVYSVEWPLFAMLAIWGWWHLIHEDPEAYRRRKAGRRAAAGAEQAAEGLSQARDPALQPDAATTAWARLAVPLVAVEMALGIAALVFVPFSRPSGWVPAQGEALYLAHACLGAALVIGATVPLFRMGRTTRTGRIVAWLGFVGLAMAGVGGLFTEVRSAVRFFGMALMLVGTTFALFAYLVPALMRSSRREAASQRTAVLGR